MLSYTTDGLQKVTIELYDVKMQLVKSVGTFDSKSGTNNIEINLNGIEAGVYFVKMSDTQTAGLQRLVIIK